ncbi:chromate transporter [Cohnella sp.]|uniref:chromate transporter n=1 Tax=Cohnella sp. TaxID=1883426 RepID=UPI003567EDE3
MNRDIKLLWSLFISFLKIGPITFGGGYAMIPAIEREVVVKRKWLRTEEITDIFAASQSVPGAIAINSATLIGYRIAGVRGAIMAMLGIFLPTFFIVLGLSIFFMEMKDNPKIEAAFISIRATIVALIVYAAYKIGKTAIVDKTTLLLVVISVEIMYLTRDYVHPIFLIGGGALVGIILVAMRTYLGWETKLEKRENEKQVYDYMI